jgi:hypothetical protein
MAAVERMGQWRGQVADHGDRPQRPHGESVEQLESIGSLLDLEREHRHLPNAGAYLRHPVLAGLLAHDGVAIAAGEVQKLDTQPWRGSLPSAE